MFIYRFLIIVLSPLIIAFFLWQSVTKKSQRYFWQHIGFGYKQLPKNSLWFHCASVGEVITLLPLLKNLHKENLHQKNPQLKFIITTNTITGSKIVAQQKLNYLFHSYLPFDWVFSIKKFIKITSPTALYVMETEIWPNLFSVCHNKKIPLHIINARLSSKTTTAKLWVKSLLKTALSKVNTIAARTEQDALAYAQLGADKKIISTVGNLKFTSVLFSSTLNDQQSIKDNNFSIEREYVLVASTHDDEELQIYKQWKKLNRKELLIIAPRHPERANAIIKKLQCNNISIRSKNKNINNATEIFLLDTVGELKNYFKNAKLVVMGGSFVPIGGHNILEPASFNSAIITGPHMENFQQELALMLSKEAIVQVASIDELGKQLNKILDNKQYREMLQSNTAMLSHDVSQILDGYTKFMLTKTTQA